MRSYFLASLLVAIMMLMSACAGIRGETTTRGTTQAEMVFVKGGCFLMGDTFGVGRSDETAHQVCVDDFLIDKNEVTQAQWTAVMGTNPSSVKECGPDCPVDNVSWNDVQEFIKRLKSTTGKTYRLPTEAEWEYAARSGGKNEVWAGTSVGTELTNFAWFEDNSDSKPHPVGTKKPNDLGIFDMTGNVWEWCQDLYADEYYKHSPNKNPQGAERGQFRVTRGGSWGSTAWHARIADRGRVLQKSRSEGLGFRLALPKAQ